MKGFLRVALLLGLIACSNAGELADGVIEQRVGVVRVQRGKVGIRTEVFHQQEALRVVLAGDLGHAHAGVFEHRADAQPRLHVFLVGRRVHDDAAGFGAQGAPVAAEAGVGGCARQADRAVPEDLPRPGQALFFAREGSGVHGRVCGAVRITKGKLPGMNWARST